MGKKSEMTLDRLNTIINDYHADCDRIPSATVPKAMQRRIDEGRYILLSNDFVKQNDLKPLFECATMINIYVPCYESYSRQMYATLKRRSQPFIIVRSSLSRRYAWRIPMVPRDEHPMYI